MSYFTSTHTLATETPLPASTDRVSALSILHDHPTFQTLQPLVLSYPVIPPPPELSWLVSEADSISSSLPSKPPIEYRCVTIAVPMGPFTSSTATTGAFINTEDGMILPFEASMGIHGRNTYQVLEKGDGLVLREEARMTGFSLMMGFVMGTKKKSHDELAEAFIRKLEERRGGGR